MHEICTYRIRVREDVDEGTLSAGGPLRLRVVHRAPEATLLQACTDQSGLVGLIRHLHGQGYLLLSVQRDG